MKRNYTYDLREFQMKCVESLDALHKVCEEHDLKYYIIDGTLLGAVRHKGFIPWDDDIDVALPRKDYDRLIENADKWFPERFHVVTHENDSHYPKYFAKLEDRSTTLVERFFLGYVGGIYIDIFPLDKAPENKMMRMWHYRKFQFVRKLIYFTYRDPYKHGDGFGARFWSFYQKHMSRTSLHAWAQNVLREYNDRGDYNYLMTHDQGLCAFQTSLFEPYKMYEFEGRLFRGPAEGDVILSGYYGNNYMTLPPEDKRVSHFHDYCDMNNGYQGIDFDKLKSEFL